MLFRSTLFDKTRKWAYRAIRQGWPEYEQWLQACYERARAYNLQLAAPLDDCEVLGIAKSISKWTASRFSPESFQLLIERTHSSTIQAKRGRKGGTLSKGGGRKKTVTMNGAPWDTLGISRSTYYRRIKLGLLVPS